MFHDPDEIDRDHDLQERYVDWCHDKRKEVNQVLWDFDTRLINIVMFAYDQGSDSAIELVEENHLTLAHVRAWIHDDAAYEDFINEITPDRED